jgi:hypothetical protein
MPKLSELIASVKNALKTHGDQEIGALPHDSPCPDRRSVAIIGHQSLNVALVPPLPTELDKKHTAIDIAAAGDHVDLLPDDHRAFEVSVESIPRSLGTSPTFTVYTVDPSSLKPPPCSLLCVVKSSGPFVLENGAADFLENGAADFLENGAADFLAPRPKECDGDLFRYRATGLFPFPGKTPIVTKYRDRPLRLTYEVWPKREVDRLGQTSLTIEATFPAFSKYGPPTKISRSRSPPPCVTSKQPNLTSWKTHLTQQIPSWPGLAPLEK